MSNWQINVGVVTVFTIFPGALIPSVDLVKMKKNYLASSLRDTWELCSKCRSTNWHLPINK